MNGYEQQQMQPQAAMDTAAINMAAPNPHRTLGPDTVSRDQPRMATEYERLQAAINQLSELTGALSFELSEAHDRMDNFFGYGETPPGAPGLSKEGQPSRAVNCGADAFAALIDNLNQVVNGNLMAELIKARQLKERLKKSL